MVQRPPDSRVTAGQQLEDRLDNATDTTRRDTATWIRRLMRATPDDPQMLSAIIGGIAGGILDQLHQIGRGDPDRIRAGWVSFVDSYLDHMAEDAEADKEEGAAPQEQTDA